MLVGATPTFLGPYLSLTHPGVTVCCTYKSAPRVPNDLKTHDIGGCTLSLLFGLYPLVKVVHGQKIIGQCHSPFVLITIPIPAPLPAAAMILALLAAIALPPLHIPGDDTGKLSVVVGVCSRLPPGN